LSDLLHQRPLLRARFPGPTRPSGWSKRFFFIHYDAALPALSAMMRPFQVPESFHRCLFQMYGILSYLPGDVNVSLGSHESMGVADEGTVAQISFFLARSSGSIR
jgi:hypothetical protein